MGKQASNLKGYDNVFARNLRKLMERKDITQEELAKKAGCSRQAVSQYMDGSSVPNVDKLLGIADYFGVSIDYLLGRENKPNEKELINQICDYTGLSEEAIQFLSYNKALYNYSFIDFISPANLIDYLLKDSFIIKGMADRAEKYRASLTSSIEWQQLVVYQNVAYDSAIDTDLKDCVDGAEYQFIRESSKILRAIEDQLYKVYNYKETENLLKDIIRQEIFELAAGSSKGVTQDGDDQTEE